MLQLIGVHSEEWGYYKLIHLEGTPLTRIDGMMIIGMFGGCFAAALWANNVKLRFPRSRVRILQAVAGGIIAGFGARLAMGCNLAAFFTWGLLTAANQPKLGLALLFGVGFGLLIERAQICFTSAFRDMWITGRTNMAKAIIFGMAASAIGIFSYVQLGMEPKIMWAGPNAVIGGLLFGFGIVLAGGCETGWMYRAVEGQVHFWWVGLGNVIGSTILAYYWDGLSPALATSWDKINLLATFGPFGGLLVTYLLLLIALGLVIGWEKRFFHRKSLATSTVKESA